MKVKSFAPARLHLGFLDLSNHYYNRFGGLGISIKKPNYEITLEKSNKTIVKGQQSKEVNKVVRELIDFFNLNGLEVEVLSSVPRHRGFGSGTALTMALLNGVRELFSLEFSLEEKAMEFGRGKYSGVGLKAFKNGGFVVEGGTVGGKKLGLFNHGFPNDWCFLIAIPQEEEEGLFGQKEDKAFDELLPIDKVYTERVCALVFKSLIPSLINEDLIEFGGALNELEEEMGKVFSSEQGGVFSSKKTRDLVGFLGKRCVFSGQSSWGPGAFALTTKEEAKELRRETKREFSDVRVLVSGACEDGGWVKKIK